jgi:methyl-accepting chemotaxis protein
MNNVTIGWKLFFGFGAVCLLLIVSNVLGIRTMVAGHGELVDVERSYQLAEHAADLRYNIIRIVDATKSLTMVETPEQQKEILARIGEFRKIYKEHLEALQKNAQTPESKALVDNLQATVLSGKEHSMKLVDLALHGDKQGFTELWVQKANPNNERVFAQCKEIQESFNKLSAESSLRAASNNRSAKWLLIVFSVIAIAFSVGIAVFCTRVITAPIKACVELADRIAEGDLTVAIQVTGKDETALLMKAMRRMSESLKGTVATLSSASADISATANQLQLTSGQLAEGAREVVSQASSVATAGEQMAATAGEIAQNCHKAATSAKRANSVAVEGFEVVDNSVAVMRTISERVQSAARSVDSLGGRSEQIGAIIGTIEDIADQTNLLALNAAIEAARAGEQGRGFAVVADEVRALAERTAKATREISGMIKNIQSETVGAVAAMEEGVKEVEKGTAETAKSGQALQAILEQINTVTEQAGQIATAAEEQTATTGEISHNMQGITDIVQRSVACASETADSAFHLSQLAQDLQQTMKRFKVAV